MRPALQSLFWGSVSGGALVYSGANWFLASHGAKHRKRSSEQEDAGSGTAIAVGALLDGIPESIAIGLSMLQGGSVSIAVVAAVAILAMIVDTMIPEAFAEAHNGAGMITALGFLASSALTKLAG